MTSLNLTLPQAGTTLNSVADPEVVAALSAIQTWANGNIDTSNMNLPSVAAGGLMRLAARAVTANVTANAGDLCIVTSGNPTVTLPAASANAVVGVSILNFAVTGALPVTVTGPALSIVGVGLNGVTSVIMGTPGATMIFMSDGAKWYIIAGPDLGAGWISLSTYFANGASATVGRFAPAYRLWGNKVELRGNLTTGTSSIGLTLPAFLTPVNQDVELTVWSTTVNAPKRCLIDTSGNANFGITASTMSLDGQSYTLI